MNQKKFLGLVPAHYIPKKKRLLVFFCAWIPIFIGLAIIALMGFMIFGDLAELIGVNTPKSDSFLPACIVGLIPIIIGFALVGFINLHWKSKFKMMFDMEKIAESLGVNYYENPPTELIQLAKSVFNEMAIINFDILGSWSKEFSGKTFLLFNCRVAGTNTAINHTVRKGGDYSVLLLNGDFNFLKQEIFLSIDIANAFLKSNNHNFQISKKLIPLNSGLSFIFEGNQVIIKKIHHASIIELETLAKEGLSLLGEEHEPPTSFPLNKTKRHKNKAD